MSGKPDVWNHDALAVDLARKLMHDGKVWCWLNSTIGAWSGPRPDVMAYRRYTYDNPQIHAYEIKVSRSDLASDLNSDKWRKYLEHCQSVTFAMPSGLCHKDEISRECGVMFRTGRGWRVERRPHNIGSGCSIQSMAKLLTEHPLRLPPVDGKYLSDWQRDGLSRLAGDKFQRGAGDKYGQALARLARDVADGVDPAGKAKEQAEKIIADAKAEAESIIGWLAPACEAVGIKLDRNSMLGLRADLAARVRALDTDARCRSATAALEAARREIDRALKNVPSDEQLDAA